MTFKEFIRTLGIVPPDVIIPERWHRCPTEDHPRSRNGAVKLTADGKAGFAQNHGTMTEAAVWRSDGAETAPASLAEMKRRNAAREAKCRRVEALASAGAFLHWRSCRPLVNGHPYLERKRADMKGCHGLRVDEEGKLLVPMYRDGQFTSLQIIDDDGGKKFWPGAPASGCSHLINSPGATITILCEGLATGLTLFAAVPGSCIVVAFSAHNLMTVARARPWAGLCVVAADNDCGTEERIGKNPGIVAATEAAHEMGCGMAAPEIDGDYNDLYCATLAEIEAEDEKLKFKRPAHPRALLPVRNAIMRALKFVAP